MRMILTMLTLTSIASQAASCLGPDTCQKLALRLVTKAATTDTCFQQAAAVEQILDSATFSKSDSKLNALDSCLKVKAPSSKRQELKAYFQNKK